MTGASALTRRPARPDRLARGSTPGSKAGIARLVHGLVAALGLRGVTLAGHDIGGMVTYAYLREFPDLPRAVIMDVPVPGVDPWDDFVRPHRHHRRRTRT